ncbi:MAG: hypothetical protein AB7P69_09035 [Candidatus Binatia bacterium]
MKEKRLSPQPLHKMHAYWRATIYLSVGQIYPCNNSSLKHPLTPAATGGRPATEPSPEAHILAIMRAVCNYRWSQMMLSSAV